MSNGSVVREHFPEAEAVNNSGNGFLIAARAKTCPAASVFSVARVVFQAVKPGSGVTCHVIVYYTQYRGLYTELSSLV